MRKNNPACIVKSDFILLGITLLLSFLMRSLLMSLTIRAELVTMSVFGFLFLTSYTFFINVIFLVAENKLVKFIASLILLLGILMITIDIVTISILSARLDLLTIKQIILRYPFTSAFISILIIIFSCILAIKQRIVENKLMKLSLIPLGVSLLIIGNNPFPNPLKAISNWDVFVNRLPVYSKITPELSSLLRLTIESGRLRGFNNKYFYFNSHFYSYFLKKFHNKSQQKFLHKDKISTNKVYSHGAFEQISRPGVRQNSKQYVSEALNSVVGGIEIDIWYDRKSDNIYLTHDIPCMNNDVELFDLSGFVRMLEKNRKIKVWLDLKNRKDPFIDLFIQKLKKISIPQNVLSNIYIEHPDPFVIRKLSLNGNNTIWSLGYGLPYIQMPIDVLQSFITFSNCKAISCRWECIGKELLHALKGFPIFTYTVNNLEKIHELAKYDSIRAIITDLEVKANKK